MFYKNIIMSSFKKDFIYLFLERGEGKEKEKERKINMWLSLTCPLLVTWPATQACALTGHMRESNQRPFGSQAGTQSSEPYQPGQKNIFFYINIYIVRNWY